MIWIGVEIVDLIHGFDVFLLGWVSFLMGGGDCGEW